MQGNNNKLFPWLLLSPALILLVGFVVVPMGLLVRNSFTLYTPGIGEVADTVTFANYLRFLTDSHYWGILLRTLRIAFEATIISLIFGYPVALFVMRQYGIVRAIITTIILAPMLINVLVRVLGWYIVLGREGIWARFMSLFFENPPSLLFTEMAVIIGLVQVYIPFMVLCLLSSLLQIDPILERAARDLGATDRQVFWKITAPLSLPGMVAGSVLTFVLCCGTFAVPALLGGQRIPVMAYAAYENQVLLLNWPFGAVLTIMLLLTVAASVMIYQVWLRNRRWGAVLR